MIDVDPLAPTAETRPCQLALLEPRDGVELTYAALDRRVDAIAAGLERSGVDEGDRIVLTTGLSGSTPALVLAVWRVGGVVVPMDPGLDADRFVERIDRIDPTLIVGQPPAYPDHLPVVRSDEPDGGPAGARSSGRTPDDVAAILFTSGTTGAAKPVALTARNLQTSAIASALRLGLSPVDRWLCVLHPHHMGGFAPIVRSVVYGTSLVVLPFEPPAIADAITSGDSTVISVVPTMLRRLLEKDVPLEDCRAVLVGGDVTPPGLVERSLDRGVPIYVSYGMTEAASQIATATPAELRSDPRTVGRPLKWTRVSIQGDPSGQLEVAGPTVAAGYIRCGNVDSFDGSFETGDRGIVAENGQVTVMGRADDRIVSGGVTVDPRTVEGAIRDLERVDDVAVIGIEDPKWGEVVGALIAPADGHVDPAEHLPSLRPAERPRRIAYVDDLPRTPSGTVDRRAVRRVLEES